MRFKPIHAITLIVLVVLLLVVYYLFPLTSSESYSFQCNQDVRDTMFKNMQKCNRAAWDKNDLRMKKKCYEDF